MAFRVGQQVECIESDWCKLNEWVETPGWYPQVGDSFSIVDIIGEFITLSGTDPNFYWHGDAFRPVQKRKTSIECFTALLNTKSVEELV